MVDLKQYKILLVDDRRDNLISLAAVLKNAGYETDQALSGEEALKLLLKNDYGLLILDVQMPEMNGFELAELIKGNSKTKDIPLIFLSANAVQGKFFNKGHEAGGLDYLTKPVDETLLLLKVKNFLQLYDITIKLEESNKLLEKRAIQARISYEDLYYSLAQEVFLINKEGVIISINRTGELCCGLHADELIDQHYSKSSFLREILDAENVLNVFKFFIDNPKGNKRSEFIIDKEGHAVYYGEASITPAIVNGKFNVQVSITDITERKIAEEKIRANELRLQTAQKIAKIGDWWFNIITSELTWSDELYSIYNCDRESFCPKVDSFIELIHPEDKASLSNWISGLFLGKKSEALVFRIINPDESIKYILGDGEIVFDKKGRPIKAFGTGQDITLLKMGEEKMKESAERFRSLFERNLAGVYRANMDNVIIECNDAFAHIIGLKNAKDAIGKHARELFDNLSHPNFDETLLDNNGKLTLQECVIQRKSGVKVNLLENASLIVDRKGKPIFMEGTIIDISERKKQEEELQKTVQELNNRYNEMMQFNYIISHNLRSPVVNIIGLANLLNMPNVNEDDKSKIINHIHTATINIDDQIKQLSLILSTRSALNTKKETVSIPNLIESITDSFEREIKDCGIAINTEINDDAKEMYSIKSYLESVFYNLISNAIKYKSPHRSLKLFISVQKLDNTYIIIVKDNGLGIDLSLHGEYVFGLYKRFNLEIEGKGLGLHMTKTQIEALNGKIAIESEPKKGTTFTITLPNN